MNPPAILDPLDSDLDKVGKKSDHRIVIAKPINAINNKCGRQFRKVKYRPFPESGMRKMKEWFIDQTWEEVYQAESAHKKAEVFQNMLLKIMEEIFPEKERKISSDDQPWITQKLKKMDRRRRRIYHKQRRSEKWRSLDKLFKKELKSAKAQFYKKTIADLKLNKHKCAQKVAKEDVCWYIFVCVVVSLHDLLYVISAKKVLSVLGESNIDLILISLLELSPYSLNVFM
jgi:hypothetical protein